MGNVGAIFRFGSSVYGYITNKQEAREHYIKYHTLLKAELKNGASFNDPKVQTLISLLEETASLGACQRNFKNAYLSDMNGLRHLKDDPNNYPFGYWRYNKL